MARKSKSSKIKNILVVVGIVAAVIIVFFLYRAISNADVSIGSDKTIEVTPEKVTEIRRIGQWEFMTVVDEQVVDTVRHNRILSDDRLTCIYYGTVSLGIDLAKAPADWVINRNDTLTVTLPQPGILDPNFIDEARTRVFYENGKWSASAREQMYRRARKAMAAEALTPDNLQQVRQLATQRFEALFRAIGAKEVTVEFEDDELPGFNRY